MTMKPVAVGDLVDIGSHLGGPTYEARVVAVRSEDDFDTVPTDPAMQVRLPGSVRVTVTPHPSL